MSVSESPTKVLAIHVTPQTYEDVYVQLANGKKGRKLSLKTLEGNVIFVPVDSEGTWGWMTREEFDATYEPLQGWANTRFTLCNVVTRPTKKHCTYFDKGIHSPETLHVIWDDDQDGDLTYCVGCGFILEDVRI